MMTCNESRVTIDDCEGMPVQQGAVRRAGRILSVPRHRDRHGSGRGTEHEVVTLLRHYWVGKAPRSSRPYPVPSGDRARMRTDLSPAAEVVVIAGQLLWPDVTGLRARCGRESEHPGR